MCKYCSSLDKSSLLNTVHHIRRFNIMHPIKSKTLPLSEAAISCDASVRGFATVLAHILPEGSEQTKGLICLKVVVQNRAELLPVGVGRVISLFLMSKDFTHIFTITFYSSQITSLYLHSCITLSQTA